MEVGCASLHSSKGGSFIKSCKACAGYASALDKIADDKPSETGAAADTGMLAGAAGYVQAGARKVAESAHPYTDAGDEVIIQHMAPHSSGLCMTARSSGLGNDVGHDCNLQILCH